MTDFIVGEPVWCKGNACTVLRRAVDGVYSLRPVDKSIGNVLWAYSYEISRQQQQKPEFSSCVYKEDTPTLLEKLRVVEREMSNLVQQVDSEGGLSLEQQALYENLRAHGSSLQNELKLRRFNVGFDQNPWETRRNIANWQKEIAALTTRYEHLAQVEYGGDLSREQQILEAKIYGLRQKLQQAGDFVS